jgi:hypothetical protein
MRNVLLAVVVVATLGCAALLVALAAHGLSTEGVRVIVNDHELHLGNLSGLHAVGAGFGLLLALTAAAIVVLLILLLGIMLPLLLAAAAVLLVVAVLLGVGGIALLPLALPLLIVAWLWRRSRPRGAGGSAGPSNTIEA